MTGSGPGVPVVLGIGANLGDRLATLQAAIDKLCATPGVEGRDVSNVYETDPVGGPEQPDYLNAVVLANTTLAPRELLAATQAVEAELHRVRDIRWGPRTIDIDVIAYGRDCSDDPILTLPHPRATERAFVLIPWLDVDATGCFPGTDQPIAELLAGLSEQNRAGVRHRGDLSLRIPGA